MITWLAVYLYRKSEEESIFHYSPWPLPRLQYQPHSPLHPLSQTMVNVKPLLIAARAANTAFAYRRGLSLLQRCVARNTSHNTAYQINDNRWWFLSTWPPLSQTMAIPKLPLTGASRGHTASNTCRGSSLLQRFLVHNQPHNTSLHKKYRWFIHHSPTAPCGTYTASSAAVALPTADLDSIGGGWWLPVQACHH